MAIYEIETDDGQVYEIETDDAPQGGVMDKVTGALKEEFKNPVNYIPGARLVQFGQNMMEKVGEGYDLMGNMAAEAIDQGGKRPILSSAVGGTIQNIPNIVAAAEGIAAAPALAKGVQSFGSTIKDMGRSIRVPEVLKNTGQQEVTALTKQLADEDLAKTIQLNKLKTGAANAKEQLIKTKDAFSESSRAAKESADKAIGAARQKIKDLPMDQANRLQQAKNRLEAAKQSIHQAEKDMGVDITKIGGKQIRKYLRNPTSFSDRYFKVATNLGPDKIAESLTPDVIQTIRKASQEAAKRGGIDDITKSNLRSINKIFGEALSKHDDNLAASMGDFKDAITEVNRLPSQFKTEKHLLNAGLQKIQNSFKGRRLDDAKIKQLERAINIVERRANTLSGSYEESKKAIEIALIRAKELAQRQSAARGAVMKILGGTAVGASLAAGSKLLGK